jgi:hypothetical protein
MNEDNIDLTDFENRIMDHSKKLHDALHNCLSQFIENEDFGNDKGQKILVGSCSVAAIKFLSNILVSLSLASDNPENVFEGFMEHFIETATDLFKKARRYKTNE